VTVRLEIGPSYGVCQATEKRARDFSSFVEQRSCYFYWVKGEGFERIDPL